MIGQQLSQTNENTIFYYSVQCNSFYHYFTHLNTAWRPALGLWLAACSQRPRTIRPFTALEDRRTRRGVHAESSAGASSQKCSQRVHANKFACARPNGVAACSKASERAALFAASAYVRTCVSRAHCMPRTTHGRMGPADELCACSRSLKTVEQGYCCPALSFLVSWKR